MNVLPLLCLLVAPLTAYTAPSFAMQHTTAHTIDTPASDPLPYRLHSPETKPDQTYPLVLFFHGSGERGDNNRSQLKHGAGELIRYSLEQSPAFVFIPQCPKEQKWVEVDWSAPTHQMPAAPSNSMRAVLHWLDHALKTLPIDPDRVYITGLSMGGYGTWDLAQRFPDRWAAALPICGGGDSRPASVQAMKNLPVWAFHGDADRAVPVERTRAMVHAMESAGGKPKYTEYPGVGHDSWTPTYGNNMVLDWLFQQRR